MTEIANASSGGHAPGKVGQVAASHQGSVRLAGWYHTFTSEASGEDLGQEVDLGVSISPFKHLTFSIEYADFFGADTVADLRRLFVTATVRY